MYLLSSRVFMFAAITVLLAACSNAKSPNEANFSHAIDAALEKNGTVCLNYNFQFPINIPQVNYEPTEFVRTHQGLALADVLSAKRTTINEAGYVDARGKRFQTTFALTERGRASAKEKAMRSLATGEATTRTQICYAEYRVAKIVNFTEPSDMLGHEVSEVRYMAKVTSVADWAKDAKVKAAIPDIDAKLTRLSTQESKAEVELTNNGWEVMR